MPLTRLTVVSPEAELVSVLPPVGCQHLGQQRAVDDTGWAAKI